MTSWLTQEEVSNLGLRISTLYRETLHYNRDSTHALCGAITYVRPECEISSLPTDGDELLFEHPEFNGNTNGVFWLLPIIYPLLDLRE